MLNALYLTADRLGVRAVYDTEVIGLEIDEGRAYRPRSAPTVANVRYAPTRWWRLRRLRSQYRVAEERMGGIADNFLVRGTPYNRGTVLSMLIEQGAESVGDATQCHAVAIDARAPKFMVASSRAWIAWSSALS